MNDLPICIHRGIETEGKFPCRTDRLIHSGHVEAETCRRCPYADKPRRQPEGFGDTLHRFFHAIRLGGIIRGKCGCARRLHWLNRVLPYKRRDKVVPQPRPAVGGCCKK